MKNDTRSTFGHFQRVQSDIKGLVSAIHRRFRKSRADPDMSPDARHL